MTNPVQSGPSGASVSGISGIVGISGISRLRAVQSVSVNPSVSVLSTMSQADIVTPADVSHDVVTFQVESRYDRRTGVVRRHVSSYVSGTFGRTSPQLWGTPGAQPLTHVSVTRLRALDALYGYRETLIRDPSDIAMELSMHQGYEEECIE